VRQALWIATLAGSHFEMLEELTARPVLSRGPNGYNEDCCATAFDAIAQQ